MNGLLNNPLLGMGIGLLSGADRGGTFAGGAQQGLQNAMLMQQANSRNQLMQLQAQKFQRDQAQLENQQKLVQKIANQMRSGTPYQQSEAETFPGEAPIEGLQTAASPEMQLQADIMEAAPQTYMNEMIKAQYAKPAQGKVFELGVPNGQKQKFTWGPNGQPVPLGQPYTPSPLVSIDQGATSAKPADLQKLINPEGQWPSHLTGLPMRDAYQQAQTEGYTPVTTSGEKLQSQQQMANTVLDEAEGMLFGENGIYQDYGQIMGRTVPTNLPGVGGVPAKITETATAMWENFAQNDPRYKQYIDHVEGTLSPLAKSLGEAGALAEGDTDRARKLLPVLSGTNIDTPQTARAKISRLRQIIARGSENKAQGIKPEKDEFGDTWVEGNVEYRLLDNGKVQWRYTNGQ